MTVGFEQLNDPGQIWDGEWIWVATLGSSQWASIESYGSPAKAREAYDEWLLNRRTN